MNTPHSFQVRTNLRAGAECNLWDTNCVAIVNGQRAMRESGIPVWDNCNEGHVGAGANCKIFVSTSKYDGENGNPLAQCVKC
jgi:hypothetical protein